jgi:hypothetical protein
MAMIRKQLYLEDRQQGKLQRLAEAWGCTEAAVMRQALDRLPDPEDSLKERLAAAGLLAPPEDDPDLDDVDVEELEREFDAWLATQTEPLGLAEAVLEDRR